MKFADTLRRILPAAWFGLLAAIAFIAAPAAFRVLEAAQAGQVVRRIFEWEAGASLALGLLLLVIERRIGLVRHEQGGTSQFTTEMVFVLGALFCTVAGFYGVQPMMEAARAGYATPLSFGQLHAVSMAFFSAKGLLVMALAWKAAR